MKCPALYKHEDGIVLVYSIMLGVVEYIFVTGKYYGRTGSWPESTSDRYFEYFEGEVKLSN